jgi:hypothetical protein
VTDAPDEDATDADADADARADANGADGDGNVVDTNVDRFIDRIVQGTGGTLTGNAMVGMAKGMGLHKEPEIAAEIREVGPPDPDDDDPIEVTIDPAHPENTRIVFRVRPPDPAAEN